MTLTATTLTKLKARWMERCAHDSVCNNPPDSRVNSSTWAPAARRLAARMAAPRRPLPLPLLLGEALPPLLLLQLLPALSLRPVSVCRLPVDMTCGHPGNACGSRELSLGQVVDRRPC
jgi:hypothetical protein